MATTDEGLYKLVIVGGGPAGIGVFIRAARTGFLPRLLDPARHGTQRDLDLSTRCGRMQKGVAVLHDGDASSFGSGNLGHYLINSNTFARSLLSSVLDEKPDLDPPETIKHTFLEHAREHASTQRLEQIGLAPACLVEMGNFLTYVGSRVLAEVAAHGDTSACLLHTRATRFDVLENGVIRVEAQSSSGESVVLHTEHLALAMGGKQELPTLDPPALNTKLFTSETCLREDGFAQLREHLLKAPDRKVCIVGGSHSSFSVAWMLLNRFSAKSASATSRCGSSITKSKLSSSAQQQQQQLNAAPATVATEPVPPEDDEPESKGVASTSSSPTKKSALPALKELVITPVSLEPLAASSAVTAPSTPSTTATATASTPLGKCESVRKPSKADPFAVFKPKDITILHRTPIRCYYGSKKDAEADGVDSSRVDRSGCVNTFTGLREDSKNLFKDVRAGRETRVRLFHVNQHGSQSLTAKAYESASAIVWCCGYKTRMIPGFDARGDAIAFYEENGVVKLDLTARLQQQAGAPGASKDALAPVANVYGLGLGFSLRSAVDEMGTETRADGVTVYHRRGAALVLAALFGPEVFGSDAKTFEEMVEKNDKKKRESLTAKGESAAAPATPSAVPLSSSSLSDKVKRHSSKPLGAHSATLSKASSSVNTSVPSKVALSLQPMPNNHQHHEHAPATNPPVKLLLERRRSVDALLLVAGTGTDALDASMRRPATFSGTMSAAAPATCEKAMSSPSMNTDANDNERVETPTHAALAASPPVSRITTKLADVNRSVTHPIRLLHETLMLELFQEQLRVPSPARQSNTSSSSRTSITAAAAAAARHSIGRATSSHYRRSATSRHSLDDSTGRASISLVHTPRPTVILYEGDPLTVLAGRPSSSSPLARAVDMEREQLRASSSATRASLTAVPATAPILDGFDTAQTRDCQICFDKMDALQAQVCVTCSGSFCSTCMQWYVEFKILDGEVSSKKLVCPAPQCTRPLPTELIEAFASQETFAKYESFLKNQKAGVRFCPRAGCCAVLDEPPHSTHRKVKCTACDTESCMRCGGAYHRTRLCRRVDKRYGHWKRHHNVRACPQCKSDIEKQGGCSHMKCFQCDQEFCWSCLRSWDKHDETLCLPLAFYHSRSRKFGWTAPVRFVTKTVVLGAASVVVVAGAGVAVVIVPPLLGYYFVRDRFSRKALWRSPSDAATAPQH